MTSDYCADPAVPPPPPIEDRPKKYYDDRLWDDETGEWYTVWESWVAKRGWMDKGRPSQFDA